MMVIDSHNIFALEVKPTVQELRRGERLEITHYVGGCYNLGQEIKVICTQLHRHKTRIKIFNSDKNYRRHMNDTLKTLLIYDKIVPDRDLIKNLDNLLFAYRLPPEGDIVGTTSSSFLTIEFYRNHQLKSSENYEGGVFLSERADKMIMPFFTFVNSIISQKNDSK
jgi:transposase